MASLLYPKLKLTGNFLGPDTYVQLIKAVKGENIAKVRKLLRVGIDPNLQDENRQSLLHITCCSENTEILDALLERNVNVNIPAQNGITPLHVAAKANNEYFTKKLLEAGASVKLRTMSLLKPIDLAKYNSSVWNLLYEKEKTLDFEMELQGFIKNRTSSGNQRMC
ncbi:ankyrin repeat domain-containing protein 23-like [Argonauta hians]